MWNIVSTGILTILISQVLTKKLDHLEDVPALQKNYIHIRNKQQLLGKLNEMIHDGYSRLHIITDFDNTLTADSGVIGKTVLNSFEMLRKCPSIPQSYKDEDYKLYLRFGAIENDPNLSIEEKSASNVEWYKATENLMKGLKFPRKELMDVALNATVGFRDRIHELFTWINNKEVPIIVVSAGLGEALIDTLQVANVSSPYMKVASNFLQVDSEDIIIGMTHPFIHSSNKNASVKLAEYREELKNRTNVILMGDTITDSYVADASRYNNNCSVLIKIGYLSTKRLPLLSDYLNVFDIVVENDQTLDVIIDLIKLLK